MTDTTPDRLGTISVEDLKKQVEGYGVFNQKVITLTMEVTNPLEQYFPFIMDSVDEEIEFWTHEGNAGLMGVSRGANVPETKGQFRRYAEVTKVDKYAYGYEYDVLEKAKTDFTKQDRNNAARWFGAVRMYKQIYALKAGAGKTVAAGATWDTQDPSDKIYECLDHLNDYGWGDGQMGPALILYPSRVGRGIKSSQYVNGSYTQRMIDIANNYGGAVRFIPIAPFRTANASRHMDVLMETESDVIGNDAVIVLANPDQVLYSKEYVFNKTPNVFTDAVKDYGITTVLHRQTGCKIVPSGTSDDTDDGTTLASTASTSIYVCKITDVAASRS